MRNSSTKSRINLLVKHLMRLIIALYYLIIKNKC